METFVEILALFGVSVDAVSFGTNASITTRLIHAVLVGEALVTSISTLVNVYTICTSLRYLKTGSALYQRLAYKRSNRVDASLVLLAFGGASLAFVNVDAGSSICGTIS